MSHCSQTLKVREISPRVIEIPPPTGPILHQHFHCVIVPKKVRFTIQNLFNFFRVMEKVHKSLTKKCVSSVFWIKINSANCFLFLVHLIRTKFIINFRCFFLRSIFANSPCSCFLVFFYLCFYSCIMSCYFSCIMINLFSYRFYNCILISFFSLACLFSSLSATNSRKTLSLTMKRLWLWLLRW